MTGMRATATFQPQRLSAEVSLDTSLLEAARQAGIPLESRCGAKGKCGMCRVVLQDGSLTEPTEPERKLLSAAELKNGFRLACEARVAGSGEVALYVPPISLVQEQKYELEGISSIKSALDPPVRTIKVELVRALPGEESTDLTRLERLLRDAHGISMKTSAPDALGKLREAIKQGRDSVSIVVRDGGLIDVRQSDAESPRGLAVDLGTSKVAMFLVDFDSGETEESLGFMNPQVPFGEDVISRIQYAGGGTKEASRLRELVIDGINDRLEEMLSARGLSPSGVAEMTVVGNTAMHHLFLGLPVKQLGTNPFEPASTDVIERDARDLGVKMLPAGKVYMPPVIAGFVGSDNLAAIIATRLHREEGPCMLVDLGTNTEVALRVDNRIVCCSCASGPAFEGGAVRHGMRASAGAIEKVEVEMGGSLTVSTVEDAEPLGICGSGILDAISALMDTGALDERGRLVSGNPWVVDDEGESAYRLEPSSVIKGGWITVTQGDIREIQKAKGAVRAGIEMILEHVSISYNDIKKVILAGAFGTHINPASALFIAMLPPIPVDRIVQVGNAAGVGARELLCSVKQRKEAEDLAKNIEHLELVGYPNARLFFASSMMLSEEGVNDYMRKWHGIT